MSGKRVKRMRNKNKNNRHTEASVPPRLDKNSIMTAFLSQDILLNKEWLQSNLSREQTETIKANARAMGIDDIQMIQMVVESCYSKQVEQYNQVIKILQITGFVSGKPCALGLGTIQITPDQPLFTLISKLLLMPLKGPRSLRDTTRNPFEGEAEEVKKIGWELHKKGGINLMYAIATLIPKCDQRLLDYLWDGVGEWRC